MVGEFAWGEGGEVLPREVFAANGASMDVLYS